jgi:hypothetical protein
MAMGSMLTKSSGGFHQNTTEKDKYGHHTVPRPYK